MKLSQLFRHQAIRSQGEIGEIEIEGITSDSREVRPGWLFVAVCGTRADGHDFIEEACARGAGAVIGERDARYVSSTAPYICVPSTRSVLSRACQEFEGNPSRYLRVIGVTGTNGKSSTVALVESILTAAGETCATIGTLGYRTGKHELEAAQTTPDPRLLARILREAKEAGVDNVVMEVSSHALEQDRTAGVDFDIAVFTNLSQDHLDYHEDIESYFEAKLKLFRMLDEPSGKTAKAAVVNADDPRCEAVAAATSKKVVRYGTGPTANIKASGIKISLQGTSFKVTGAGAECSVRLQLVGQHNVMNALAATAVAVECGVGAGAIKGGIEKLETVPGRFEMIDCGQPFSVVVDYAHTEDGLRNLLLAARSVTTGRVIAVFGCGGDRDRTKRPKMAQVVARMSDFAVLTSDNPRTEDPVKIALDAEVGLQHEGKAKGTDYIVELDRREAIGRAVSVAQPGDILVIAGKGHETYQIIGETRVPFDDRKVARETLRACL